MPRNGKVSQATRATDAGVEVPGSAATIARTAANAAHARSQALRPFGPTPRKRSAAAAGIVILKRQGLVVGEVGSG